MGALAATLASTARPALSPRAPAASSRRWLVPALLVGLALVLRTGVVLADTGYRPQQDALAYDHHARSIAAGDGYPQSAYVADGGPSALRAPGYPYFLAAVYALSGDSITTGRLANAALGALAVLLIYLIAEVIWGRRVALLAAALVALFPPLVLLSRDLLSESLFLVFELGAVLCVLAYRRSPTTLRLPAAAGALCGLAALTRNPGPVLLIPVALGVWTLRPRLRARSLAAPAVLLICAALTIAPWTLRNVVEFGRFIPITTSTGFALAGTYNEVSLAEHVHPAAWRNPLFVPRYARLFQTPGIDEGTLDATLRREATSFAWKHPAYVAEATASNLLRLFELSGASVVGPDGVPVNDRGIGSADPTLERVSLGVAMLLALVGVLAILQRRGLERGNGFQRGPWFLWLVPILSLLAAAPVAGLPRYRVPSDPFLLLLAALGLMYLFNRVIRAEGAAR